MNVPMRLDSSIPRRVFLRDLGGIALAALLPSVSAASSEDVDAGQPRRPHFAAKINNIISIHLSGGPSQLDLFDYKPALQRYDGDFVPNHLIQGQRFSFLRGRPKLLGTRYRFHRRGEAGIEMSELLPHLGTVADDLVLIKSMHTEENNHAPAELFMHTGFGRFGRPSMGSWVAYGLGPLNRNLPAYVVLVSNRNPIAGASLWSNGFLPGVYQGVQLGCPGDALPFPKNPPGVTREDRRASLDTLRQLNEMQLAELGDPEIATRIAQYEVSFGMQTALPEVANLSAEPPRIHEMYRTTLHEPSFANHCLLARRLVERGVRFVQLYDSTWDHHKHLFSDLPSKCYQVDKPAAALIRDLKQRGLLEETLVVFGGEFGRTPMRQDDDPKDVGRDHHKEAFTMLLAGGGLKRGLVCGQTDDLGYYPTQDCVSVNDLNATMLHLLGLDHERLTFPFQGRAFRLTDTSGNLIRSILA
jgi:hypothetical protein